jgi:hypothetical protein
MRLWQLCSTSDSYEGLYLCGILAVVLLCIAGVRALVTSCLLVSFLSLWCHIIAEAASRILRLVVRLWMALDWHLWRKGRWLWVAIGLSVCLIEQILLHLFLLMKNINCLLEFS